MPLDMAKAAAMKRNVSDASIRKATGRSTDEWFALLDARGGTGGDHKSRVRLLAEAGLASAWHQQTLTVMYEKERGLREPGQTATAGYEIGVRRTVPLPPDQVWARLTSARGLPEWLEAAPPLEPGTRFALPDGATGEVRTVQPGSRVRLVWKGGSTLQVTLTPTARGCTVTFHQEKLPDGATRERMREHWRAVLERCFPED